MTLRLLPETREDRPPLLSHSKTQDQSQADPGMRINFVLDLAGMTQAPTGAQWLVPGPHQGGPGGSSTHHQEQSRCAQFFPTNL